MPIKPENRLLYPPRKEWAAIRAEVLKRAQDKCEQCGLPNHIVGRRNAAGVFQQVDGERALLDALLKDGKVFRVVLTIAHLDHNPANNGTPGNRPNLRAWCQRCHLAYDQGHHMANSRRTRDAKKGQETLPLEAA